MESSRSAWLTEQGEGHWDCSSVCLVHAKRGRGTGIIAQVTWYIQSSRLHPQHHIYRSWWHKLDTQDLGVRVQGQPLPLTELEACLGYMRCPKDGEGQNCGSWEPLECPPSRPA